MTDLHELLTAIDPAQTDYTEWVTVGMAIKQEGGTVTDWEEWSARDSQRYHQGECAKKWNGFQGSGAPVTLGTLVELAKRHGWRPTHNAGPNEAMGWDDVVTKPAESLQFIDTTWLEPVELDAPTAADWSPAKELSSYISALFEAQEYVGYVTDSWINEDGKHLPKKGSFTRTAGELLQDLAKYGDDLSYTVGSCEPECGAWIRFNPLDGKGVRDDNVTAFRYALVESDTLAVDKQAAIYAELELPIAALVHSGGKSLHAIVRINATSKEEYRERVNFLHKVCQKNGLEIDTQNKNPSRLSRMPGVLRNGHKQYLVAVNQGKESWEAWKEFVEEANDNLPDFEALDSIFDNLPDLAAPLIDGVLRQGHKGLLTGPSKAGKSYMLLQLTLAIAEGREWLGWPCAQGRVLYVNLELDRASCLHRIKDLYDKLGWAPSNVANIDLWNLRGKAVPMDTLAPKLIRRAHKRGYKAIIIDPIYKVITGDENAADKMAFFCNQFDRVCAELGAAVIYCHHHSKGAQGQKSARDRSSGSGVFARDPDAILDIIELNVTDTMRKAVTDRKIADEVANFLDEYRPQWRDDLSQDDAIIAEKVLAYGREKLGAALDQHLTPLNKTLEQMTGWRMEGTLREFAPMAPRCFWFRHPFHTMDQADALGDAKAEGEEPQWKAQADADKEARKARREQDIKRLSEAFMAPHFEHGFAELANLASTMNLDEKRVKALLPAANLIQCVDGKIRPKEEGEEFNEANPKTKEKKPSKAEDDWSEKLARTRRAIMKAAAQAPDGIARIGTVTEILALPGKNPVNTVRNWITKCDEYRRNEDGTITPVEGE